ncbi:hypothetical protein GOBAR_DD19110 [Gossypium barbadense]|nr:hypothetical protein GOBAR_DD19110 [Gossypium barbadense]
MTTEGERMRSQVRLYGVRGVASLEKARVDLEWPYDDVKRRSAWRRGGKEAHVRATAAEGLGFWSLGFVETVLVMALL